MYVVYVVDVWVEMRILTLTQDPLKLENCPQFCGGNIVLFAFLPNPKSLVGKSFVREII